MTKETLVANRFATTLIDLTEEKDTLLEWEQELNVLGTVFEDEEIKHFFFNYVIEPEHKKKIIQKAAEKMNLSSYLQKFVILLIEKRIIHIFPSIIREYNKILDEKFGRAKFIVSLGASIDAEAKSKISKKLSQYTAKPPEIEYKVDKEILSGFVAKSENLLIDFSTKSQMYKLKNKMIHR